MTKITLVFRAYVGLIAHDLFMFRNDFASLHRRVKGYTVRPESSHCNAIEAIASAVDIACIFYPKPVLCLQRSALLVKMLRGQGVAAHLVIGAQKLPFKAHAWVEVDGQIINDRLASREKFLVIEEC